MRKRLVKNGLVKSKYSNLQLENQKLNERIKELEYLIKNNTTLTTCCDEHRTVDEMYNDKSKKCRVCDGELYK